MNIIGKCPSCGIEVVGTGDNYACSGESGDCNFLIPKVLLGKEITVKQAKTLLAKNKTGVIKGFVNNQGEMLNGALIIQDDYSIGYDWKTGSKVPLIWIVLIAMVLFIAGSAVFSFFSSEMPPSNSGDEMTIANEHVITTPETTITEEITITTTPITTIRQTTSTTAPKSEAEPPTVATIPMTTLITEPPTAPTIATIAVAIKAAISKQPALVHEMRQFLNYHAPTTTTLLTEYHKVRSKPDELQTVPNAQAILSGIENHMETTVRVYEDVYNDMLKSRVYAVKAEINVNKIIAGEVI